MSNKIKSTAVILLLTMLLGGGISAWAVVIDRIVAVVNEDVITLSELQEEGLPIVNQIKESFTGEERLKRIKQIEKQALDYLIDKKLMLAEAQKESLNVTPADVNSAVEEIKKNNNITTDEELRQGLARERLTYEGFRKKIEEQLVLLRITTRKVKSKIIISEADIKKYYQEHQAEFELAPEYRVRLIFLKLAPGASAEETKKVEDTAKEILSKLKAGADFGESAKKYSEDVTALAGGDLGYVKSKDMVPELEKVCQKLEKGQVSDMIKTLNGIHVIKMEDKRPSSVKSLEEVTPQIKETLTQKLYEQKYTDWIKELRSQAYIDIRL